MIGDPGVRTPAVRWYRRFLTVFPHGYRNEAADELCQVFADEHLEASRRGRLAVAALWSRVALDTALSMPGAWWALVREQRSAIMRGWLRELGDSFKSLARRPAFALTVTLVLGLGIGATTTILSVVDGVMLRPLPYDEASRLVTVGTTEPSRSLTDGAGLVPLERLSMLAYLGLKDRARSFDGLAALEPTSVFLKDEGDGPDEVRSARVASDLFDLLGVAPLLGRTFLPEEHRAGSQAAVMITYGAWQRRYGGDPNVVGRSASRFYQPTTIVGVLPPAFRAPEAFFPAEEAPEFWLPIQPDHSRYRVPRPAVWVVGKLRRQIPIAEARAEATRIAGELALALPQAPSANAPPGDIGLNRLHDQTVGTSGSALVVFLGAAALLLMLAAMNAATLFLARLLDRGPELSVRMALGAGRGRIARLLLSEAIVVASLACVLGVGLAYGGVALFLRFAPISLPNLASIAVDGRFLACSVAVSLGSGLAAGLVPAFSLLRRPPRDRLGSGGRTTSEPVAGLRTVLVGGQVAIAMVLLSGASMMFSSFTRIRSAEPGFAPDGLVTFSVGVEGAMRSAAPGTMTDASQAWDVVLGEIAAVPGVTAVAGATSVPFQAPRWAPGLHLEGDAPERWREGIAGYAVTPGYLSTLGIARRAGRWFDGSDRGDTERVAVVNETFVRTQFNGRDPVGMLLRRADLPGGTPVRIVGVIADVVQTRVEDGPRPAIYVPHTQYKGTPQVIVRTSLPLETIAPSLRRAVARFNSIEPVRDLRAMRDRMGAARADPRFQSALVAGFALVAVLLAAAGLYGSLSHWVARRRRELAIRMALGADRGRVLRMVLGQGLGVALVGVFVGIAGAVASGRMIKGLLYGVNPYDPALLLVAGAVLLLVAVAASRAPARRATIVEPATVLNSE